MITVDLQMQKRKRLQWFPIHHKISFRKCFIFPSQHKRVILWSANSLEQAGVFSFIFYFYINRELHMLLANMDRIIVFSVVSSISSIINFPSGWSEDKSRFTFIYNNFDRITLLMSGDSIEASQPESPSEKMINLLRVQNLKRYKIAEW